MPSKPGASFPHHGETQGTGGSRLVFPFPEAKGLGTLDKLAISNALASSAGDDCVTSSGGLVMVALTG